MKLWFADVRIPILRSSDPALVLFVPSVPAVHFNCGLESNPVHLFENKDGSDTDLKVIQETFQAEQTLEWASEGEVAEQIAFGVVELLNPRCE